MELTCEGRPIRLREEDFLAEGGQARVYARDGVAYKVFTAPPPPTAKLALLRRLAHPGIVTPGPVLEDPSGRIVGFTMPHLAGWSPLVRLFPRTYRERHGLDVDAIGALVLQLAGLVRHAHAHDARIVDLNELNVLVAPDHGSLALIDVDSWQLPGHPASAIAPSVRDHRTAGFDTRSDWYAFAVVSFQLFAGIHPYRGRHPGNPDLEQRVKRCLSVFHPDTIVPPMAELRVPWRAWYEAVFARGHRQPPPTALLPPEAPWVPLDLPSTLRVRSRIELPDPILGAASWGGRCWLWTQRGLYEGRRRLGEGPPRGALPVRTRDGLTFVDPRALGAYEEVVAHHGVLHGRIGGQLVRLEPTPLGLASRVVCTVPRSARLYRGCAVASALGTTWLIRLDGRGATTTRCAPLEGQVVVDAEHQDGVTVVVTRGPDGFVRHVLGPDGHRSAATEHPEAMVRVLPNGVALVQEPDAVELFAATAVTGDRRRLPIALPRTLEPSVDGLGMRQGTTWAEVGLVPAGEPPR